MSRTFVPSALRPPSNPRRKPTFRVERFLLRLDVILIRIAVTLLLIDDLFKSVAAAIWRTIRETLQ